jgi:hypothetical protein
MGGSQSTRPVRRYPIVTRHRPCFASLLQRWPTFGELSGAASISNEELEPQVFSLKGAFMPDNEARTSEIPVQAKVAESTYQAPG